MIIANITTWRGQDIFAIHYYCEYRKVDDLVDKLPSKNYQGGSFNKEKLERVITDQAEVDLAIERDEYCGFKIGRTTTKFNSIEEIHSELRNQFQFQDMVTYYEGQLFKEMLYIYDGVDLGVQGFGDQFTSVPWSCYIDLIPDDRSAIKIKCENCGHEYTLDEVAYEREWGERNLLQFIPKKDMDETCCKYFDLIWNVIL